MLHKDEKKKGFISNGGRTPRFLSGPSIPNLQQDEVSKESQGAPRDILTYLIPKRQQVVITKDRACSQRVILRQ